MNRSTKPYRYEPVPEYYNSVEEAEQSKYNRMQSNPRYNNFTQTHFTCGDENQFENYRNKTKSNPVKKHQKYTNTLNENTCPSVKMNEVHLWNKYSNLCAKSVSNTFAYIFHKYKKGIFIQIRNNKVSVMLPFSKHNFCNEWSHRIGYDESKFDSMIQFFEYVSSKENSRARKDGGRVREFRPNRVHKEVNKWYANNALVRCEYPITENDSGVSAISHMFLELCRTYTVPDMEFFVNRRDNPLLRKDGNEAYTYLFGENHKLVSHEYESYSPILSMCSSDKHADVPIPTWDDWSRVMSEEGKYFPKSPVYRNEENVLEWSAKKPVAVFRGASTGMNVDQSGNARLHISLLSKEGKIDANDGLPFLDAGITKWNFRPRVSKSSGYLETIECEDSIGTVPFMSLSEQSGHKYIIHIDGHVSAFRLSGELGTKSCILKVDSEYNLWYSHALKPYVHYIPIRSDLSDIYSQIEWCKTHDNECKQIADNAYDFYCTFLSKLSMLKYLQQTLIKLHEHGGDYEYSKSVLEIQFEDQREHLRDIHPQPPASILKMCISHRSSCRIPRYPRSYDLLCGIQWYLRAYSDSCEWADIVAFEEELKQTKKTIVSRFSFDSQSLVGKQAKTYDVMTENELIHETYVGIYCVNDALKYMPNFVYTFGFHRASSTIYTEYVGNTVTLLDYMQSSEFRMHEYVFILVQLGLVLQEMQERYLFIHYDLYPWNILLCRYACTQKVMYTHGSTTIEIETTCIPILIDYGKSHMVHENRHYGFVKPYEFSSVHDILTILISSMNVAFSRQSLSKSDLSVLFTLSRFFSGGSYTNGKQFQTVKQLRGFLSASKKFSEMLYASKHELEMLTPYDLVVYIQEKTDYIFPIQVIDRKENKADSMHLRYGSPAHVMDYMLADSDEKRLQTYTNTISRINKTVDISTSPFENHFLYIRLNTWMVRMKTVISTEITAIGTEELSVTTNQLTIEMKKLSAVIGKLRRTSQLDDLSWIRDVSNSTGFELPPEFPALTSCVWDNTEAVKNISGFYRKMHVSLFHHGIHSTVMGAVRYKSTLVEYISRIPEETIREEFKKQLSKLLDVDSVRLLRCVSNMTTIIAVHRKL